MLCAFRVSRKALDLATKHWFPPRRSPLLNALQECRGFCCTTGFGLIGITLAGTPGTFGEWMGRGGVVFRVACCVNGAVGARRCLSAIAAALACGGRLGTTNTSTEESTACPLSDYHPGDAAEEICEGEQLLLVAHRREEEVE